MTKKLSKTVANKKGSLEDMSFNELTSYVTSRVHIALLEEGGKGMRQEIGLWLGQAIHWNQLQEEKEKAEKKAARKR